VNLLELFALTLLSGSLVYCVLALIAAARYRKSYRSSGTPRLRTFPPVSVLRPLHGADDDTAANLRSLFDQHYPDFEILLSVHDVSDPAFALACRLIAEHPGIPARLITAGESPLPNAKVWSLRVLLPEAKHETLVMSDSDICLEPDALRTILAELEQPGVALVTCPYRAIPGQGFWPRLEALGLNTEFFSGVLTARLLHGMDFAIGCTVAVRRADLRAIGGLEHLQQYLAEDFIMGNLMRQPGRRVVLSQSVIAHSIGGDSFVSSWRHRLRWARSTRRSRPWGYIGELFTRTYAISLALILLAPRFWIAGLAAIVLRLSVDCFVGIGILHDPLVRRCWWLLPVEGIASFAAWLGGFFGNTIVWRGRKLLVARDGSFVTEPRA